MAQVTFDHVTKAFGNVLAVNDLMIEVPDGEFLVLVGPSGCGKSTALRLLAGLEELSSGNIYIGDRLVNNVAAKDRDIAMVFQTYALYPHMSLFDNMAFGLKLRKLPKQEVKRRVQAAAEILGLQDLLARKPRALSGGQRQRVALGRAIVREPAVFLLDEPLSNLDAKLRVQTRAELSKLHERLGTTFIYVTHDQVEAMTMASRIAVLDYGVLQQAGTPQELYNHPVNTFVAGFIGSPAMNFFEATIGNTENGLRIDAGPFRLEVPSGVAPRLGASGERPVVFGIRPEHIHDSDFVPPGVVPAKVEANVDIVEQMGSETLLHFERSGTRFTARVDSRTKARSGETTRVVWDLSHIHLFEPDSEQAISLR